MEQTFFSIFSGIEISMLTLVLAVLLLFVTRWIVCKKNQKKFSPEEMEEFVNKWTPEPIICNVSTQHKALVPRTVTGMAGHYITVDGKKCLNVATHNYLGFIENKHLQNSAADTIKKYGVGSCGPRGFYGTLDVHLELEEKLAEFMNCEEAVVYSYGFSTVASAIAAYCKRGDMIFADEHVSFAAQKGIDASRSTVYYFKHNDLSDLEQMLIKTQSKTQKSKYVQNKRLFLIIEGIYMNTGEICPLPELVQLSKKYKLRIFLDETVSFGVLGKTGRGVTQHFNINHHDIDLIMGSLEWSIASIGGFCVGSHFIIEHQRLSGQGYCFSASLPPLLTKAAIDALQIMDSSPDLFEKLADNCKSLHERLLTLPHLNVSASPESPVKHLILKNRNVNEDQLLDKIVEFCYQENVALTMAAYLSDVERSKVPPSIRLTVSVVLTKNDIDKISDVLSASSELCSAVN